MKPPEGVFPKSLVHQQTLKAGILVVGPMRQPFDSELIYNQMHICKLRLIISIN